MALGQEWHAVVKSVQYKMIQRAPAWPLRMSMQAKQTTKRNSSAPVRGWRSMVEDSLQSNEVEMMQERPAWLQRRSTQAVQDFDACT
eukprot:1029504-Pelagomonas_calceolata.AAC.1